MFLYLLTNIVFKITTNSIISKSFKISNANIQIKDTNTEFEWKMHAKLRHKQHNRKKNDNFMTILIANLSIGKIDCGEICWKYNYFCEKK